MSSPDGRKRVALVLGVCALAGALLYYVVGGIGNNLVYYLGPTEVLAKGPSALGASIRLGGLVMKGSVERGQGTTISFKVTDTLKEIPVTYTGVLPDLFREGQGVVAEGKLDATGGFVADSVLAKHDENYMPKEVKASLEARGVKLGNSAHPEGEKK